MKCFLPFFFALSLLSVPVFAAPEKRARPQAPSDVEIVPAPGEYVVLISEKTFAKKDWKAAANKFISRYRGKRVVWRGEDIDSAREDLKKANPRYVAVIAAPEEIDRVFVAKLHRLSRAMNDDPYGDFLWGIVTGKDGAAAATLLAKDKPLILDRAIGTTNFDQARFKKSFFITDWGAREFVETTNYASSGKTPAPAGEEMTSIFSERWKDIRPQFIISASHASEFNLEMPFSEGLLASAGTEFYLVEKPQMPRFLQCLGREGALADFAKNDKLKKLPKTQDDKIWIAAGNCLLGDVMRSPISMPVTAISAANVKQLVGYTVPTWFGEGGWGTVSCFFNGHQTTSVGQAWFFNNQLLLNSLPAGTHARTIGLSPNGMDPIRIPSITSVLREAGVTLPMTPERNKIIGRFHDRDVVAFYGDPLFRAGFNPEAASSFPWNCKMLEKNGRQLFTIKPSRGKARGDFCLWFPKRFDMTKKLGIRGKEIKPTILTENFVIFRGLELSDGESLKLAVPEKK